MFGLNRCRHMILREVLAASQPQSNLTTAGPHTARSCLLPRHAWVSHMVPTIQLRQELHNSR
jgi:hypothetical protein